MLPEEQSTDAAFGKGLEHGHRAFEQRSPGASDVRLVQCLMGTVDGASVSRTGDRNRPSEPQAAAARTGASVAVGKLPPPAKDSSTALLLAESDHVPAETRNRTVHTAVRQYLQRPAMHEMIKKLTRLHAIRRLPTRFGATLALNCPNERQPSAGFGGFPSKPPPTSTLHPSFPGSCGCDSS